MVRVVVLLVAAALQVVVIVMVRAAMSPQPSGVRVVVGEDALTVDVQGLDVLWALKRRIVVPLDRVESARAASRRSIPIGMRMPGTHVPGVITAGFYGTGDERSFWDVRRAKTVLLLELDGHAYRRIVLEVDDPAAVAAEVELAKTAA